MSVSLTREAIRKRKKTIKLKESESFLSDGTSCAITNLNDGSGKVVQYHENGKVSSEMSYSQGLLDGPYFVYYENGKPSVASEYNSGNHSILLYYR